MYDAVELTGYQKSDEDSVPGYEVIVHVSPFVDDYIKFASRKTPISREDMVASYVYEYFRGMSSEFKRSFVNPFQTYTWVSETNDGKVFVWGILYYDRFDILLLHAKEADLINKAVKNKCERIELGWVTVSFEHGGVI